MEWFPPEPEPGPCDACHQVHERCVGHDADGDPCERKTYGARYCHGHMGDMPILRAARSKKPSVRRSFVEGQIGRLLKECDIPTQHPLDGLLEVVRQSGAMFRMLGGLVGQLNIIPGVELAGMSSEGNPTYTNTGFTGYNHLAEEVPSALVSLYGIWADRYARACKLALDANIDERLVRNAEQTSNVLFEAIGKALKAVDLTPVQLDALRASFAAELRKVVDPSALPISVASRG